MTEWTIAMALDVVGIALGLILNIRTRLSKGEKRMDIFFGRRPMGLILWPFSIAAFGSAGAIAQSQNPPLRWQLFQIAIISTLSVFFLVNLFRARHARRSRTSREDKQ
ncbi:MAG: hypothetical protein JW941_13550 [Candidatus Coatesbacteria bacterium]|nr:hypothetical protein [Candidatus Coatesbacteria bacterium]